MLYQNRAFFRKLIKLNLKSTKNIFLNKNKSFTSSNNQKLTPHKNKKTNLFNPTNIIFFNSQIKTSVLKTTKINLSARAIPHSALKMDYLGITYLTHTVSGNCVNMLWSYSQIHTHYVSSISGMYFQLNSLNILSNILLTTSYKRFGVLSAVTGHINSAGFLIIKLGGGEVKLLNTKFSIGVPSKDRTNNTAITSHVRSIAKNPIDHPNGGRASTKGSFKTP